VDEPPQDRAAGLLRGATEELLERLRTLADLTRSAGTTTLGALPGQLPGAAGDVLTSLRRLVEQAPPPVAAIELFLEEVKAKRALVQALQAQLASFDSQLDVMQRSLEPLQAWGRQWTAVQEGLLDVLRLPGAEDDPASRE
jgi:hypothetical protein